MDDEFPGYPMAANACNPNISPHTVFQSMIRYTELTEEIGRGLRKMLTNRARMCRKLLNPTTKNVPGTAMLEHASTMVKCTEPALPYENH